MIQNYVPAEHKTETRFDLTFFYSEDSGGFAFPCDAAGNVFSLENEEARKNLEYCLAHPEEFETYNEVRRWINRYTEPAHGTCICGTEVELYDQYYGACQCPSCGRWYNLFGQSLLPPEQWERDPSEEEYW